MRKEKRAVAIIWMENMILVVLALYLGRSLLSHILTWCNLRRKKHPASPETNLPPISIIKPVRGLDQEAEENFRSFIAADYPAAFELIFCVEDRDDPAVPLIERLIAEAGPSSKARLIFSERHDQSEMGKTLNLIAGVGESKHDFLVFSDSDTRNNPGFLADLVRPLLNSETGMSYACPVYKGARNWVAGMMALAIDETILALATAPASTAIGSAMAIRNKVLDAIGGLAPLRHRVGIDAALGRAVCAKGYRIALIRRPVTVIHRDSSFRSWWRQMHRWLVTIRRYVGPAYLFIPFFGFPAFWGSLYLLLSILQGKAIHGLAVWSLVLAARFGSLTLVNLFFAKDGRLWRYLWLEACLNPCVTWRGRKFRVMRDASVEPAE